MNKWLKRIAMALGALLALGAVFALWLLGTESGAHFVLDRAKAALGTKFDYTQAHGALASPLQLAGLRWRDPAAGIDVSIQSIKVDYALASLLLAHSLHVAALDVDGVQVTLTSVLPPAAPAAAAPSMQFLLTPPLAILLDRAHVGRVNLSRDGKPVFASDSLDLAASWTNAALTIRQLVIRAPDGKVDLDGALTSYRDYRGNAKLAFDWKLAAQRVAGTLDLANDGAQTTLALALAQPAAAKLDATLKSFADALPWTLNLVVPRMDPRPLGGGDALRSLALELKGGGDRTHGVLTGSVELNAHRVLLDPLQFAVADKNLRIENLRLRAPDATGALTAKANLRLDAQPLSADATLDWQDVELPADLVGQPLATHGHLAAHGNADRFAANGELSIGPPGSPADIALELDGTPQVLALHRLELKQPKGGLQGSGEITLQPQIGWNLTANASQLNPGAFARDWPGAVDFALSTNGKIEKDGPAGSLKLDRLGGVLRQRALGGNADLRFAAPLAVDGTLALKSGSSTITLQGKSGGRSEVKADFNVASLSDWLPQAGGSLHGKLTAQGAWPKLDARGRIDAANLACGDVHAEAFTLDLDAHDLGTPAPSGRFALDAKSLATAGYRFDTFGLDAHGDASAHALTLDARGPQLRATLKLDGALNGSDWLGSLSQLDLAPKNAPAWTLQHSAALAYKGGRSSVDQLCLGSAAAARLCASASQDSTGAGQAKFSIAHLPLTTFAHFASPDALLKLEGEINGDGDITHGADGALTANAAIASASGSLAYPDSATHPAIAYQNFSLTAALAPQSSIVEVRADLNDGGRLDGHIALGANGAGGMPLSGNVAATLSNLAFVDLLNEQTSATKGKLDAQFALAGSTAAPVVHGRLALTDFATEVPAAGLKLHDGAITLRSDDGKVFTLDGHIGSGAGKLALDGSAGIGSESPLALTVRGEDFLAADIPGAQVLISSDLKLARNAGKFLLTGSVAIPKADIDASKLPGGGAAATSPDVVVTDAQGAPVAGGPALDADITVKLGAGEKLDMDLRQGQEVHLVGFGLNGYLGGQLAVQERPGRAATGRGQIVVDGTYKAYGQDLKIDQGRLLFAGTPLDNPGLDLRATRSFSDPDVTVGLQVRGTAAKPVLTVYSTPAMEQSDALSYLVAGKPLSSLKSGEGDAVGNAARALGTAGGDLLAKSIGSKMGIDEVGVADSSAVGGAALTVGKYLSPRLYLSYGVGLFTPGQVVTLRYRLTRLFNVEMQNGTLSSRAGINYKVEK